MPELLVFGEIGSSNDVARQLALTGAAAGTVVIAERQMDGRGRMGRRWFAEAGSSLLISVIMRPLPGDDNAPGTLPIRVGMAVARAIRATTGLDACVKWPNDVVLRSGAKLAGILCEGIAAGTDSGFVIAGIGINVRQQADDWPPTLRDRATSIDACIGRPVDRAALAGALLNELQPLWTAPLRPLSNAEITQYEGCDPLAGHLLAIHANADVTHALALGIEPDGALLVRRDDGTADRITSATVRRADDHLIQSIS